MEMATEQELQERGFWGDSKKEQLGGQAKKGNQDGRDGAAERKEKKPNKRIKKGCTQKTGCVAEVSAVCVGRYLCNVQCACRRKVSRTRRKGKVE